MKRALSSLSESELRQLVSALCAANKENALLAEMFINRNRAGSLDEFKDKIDKAFEYKFGRHGSFDKKWSFREAKRCLALFKKFSSNPTEIAELHVYAAETGNSITMDLGDVEDNYYTAMENLFESACGLVAALPETPDSEKLRLRLKNMMDETSGIGWGYHDTLGDLYFEKFED